MRCALLYCSVAALLGLFLTSARGQDLIAEEDTKKFDSLTKEALRKLCVGEKDYAKADEKLVRQAAEFYVYTVTISARQSEPGVLAKHLVEFGRQIDAIVSADPRKNQKFSDAFARQLVDCFKDVFKVDPLKFRSGYTNAATMLPALGKLPEPAVEEFLSDLIKGKSHTVAKLYAFKGLAEGYFRHPIKLNEAVANKVRQAQAARLAPLIDFIKGPSGLAPKAPPEEVEAFRFVRKEAIRALAQVRWPCIPQGTGDGLGYDGPLEAPVAHALLCVLTDGKTALDPPASFQEKFEAALGICQLHVKPMPRYRPEAGITLVGRFLVDYVQTYLVDKDKFTDPGNPKKLLRPPIVPWRVYSERLKMGLQEFGKNVPPNSTAGKTLDALLKESESLVEGVRTHKQNEQPNGLRNLVVRLPQPGPTIYVNSPLVIDTEWPPR